MSILVKVMIEEHWLSVFEIELISALQNRNEEWAQNFLGDRKAMGIVAK